MAKQLILLVDDEPVWQRLLSRFFIFHGYNVLTASSCAGAIEEVKLNRPDCMVLDFNLSDGDGSAVCAGIRASEEQNVPIVIFSSDPAAEGCLTGEYPADKFLLKGSPLPELLAAVQELLAVSGRWRGHLS